MSVKIPEVPESWLKNWAEYESAMYNCLGPGADDVMEIMDEDFPDAAKFRELLFQEANKIDR